MSFPLTEYHRGDMLSNIYAGCSRNPYLFVICGRLGSEISGLARGKISALLVSVQPSNFKGQVKCCQSKIITTKAYHWSGIPLNCPEVTGKNVAPIKSPVQNDR